MGAGQDSRASRLQAGLVGVILILAVPVAYVGSYLLLMNHQTVSMTVYDAQHQVMWQHARIAHFRAGGQVTIQIFRPALWLDRTLRPGYWDVDIPDGTSG